MTIIDILLEHIHDKNPYERQALEIIRDSYISSVNDNYTLIVDPMENCLLEYQAWKNVMNLYTINLLNTVIH